MFDRRSFMKSIATLIAAHWIPAPVEPKAEDLLLPSCPESCGCRATEPSVLKGEVWKHLQTEVPHAPRDGITIDPFDQWVRDTVSKELHTVTPYAKLMGKK